MIALPPLNQPPGPLPDVRRDYPADRNHFELWRRGYQIEYIVVHSTHGPDSRKYLSTTSAIVDGVDQRVSIHKLVRAEGVYSIVPPAHTAWHAGRCIPPYGDVMNAKSLGVEIENLTAPGHAPQPYRDSDYNFTAHTIAGWMFSYAIPWERVLRHADVAAPLGRKTDPDGLDWARLQRETYAWLRFFRALKQSEHAKYIY
jgi:N-acetyl-anhydromuramyl-L-alanine amidase AmpD